MQLCTPLCLQPLASSAWDTDPASSPFAFAMASDALHRFVCLCRYLQDPCHVARFQQLCGVRGTFPKKTAESDETNGACAGQCAAGGDSAHRFPGQKLRKSLNAVEDVEQDECSVNGPSGQDAERDSKGTVKPLRRNSLTGDVGQEFIIENRLLFYLFTVGTELGNEMFFIVFFSFLMWNVDPYVSRQLIVVWAWVLFLGQSTKDVVRWTRPASPPVVKVEVFYNTEYSMPSTHAMTGTALPFCLFLLTCSRWQVWCTLQLLHAHNQSIILPTWRLVPSWQY